MTVTISRKNNVANKTSGIPYKSGRSSSMIYKKTNDWNFLFCFVVLQRWYGHATENNCFPEILKPEKCFI